MDVEELKVQEEADEQLINEAFQKLLDDYLSSRHRKKVDLITKAFNFARQAHKGVRRLSGEPYIMHPIAVAQIACSEIGLGSTSICSALLHDVVEDTDYTVEDIENIFGSKIAQIVDGLTKISGGIFGEQASAQAENFKKLLLTMSDDIRVILIKICDRLHNMRTLDSQPASKQYKIAGETLYIYAPLANRLGLNKIKSELENLSFRFEHPDEFAKIESKLESTHASRHELFDQFTAPIKESLQKMGIQYEIKERVKSPYSIWNKMQNKHVTFEEIYDILAVRIIFTPKVREEEVNECFNIYVAISKIYKSHPDRLRDWLSHPKANGYQALHVTLMSKQGRWIEVQIRSDRMDEVAEQGFAAHWKYKDGVEEEYTEDENELNDWLHTIKEILDDPQPDAMDFLDTIKLNLFASEIFVFTPKGEIRTLPADCTALDFAFSIHTFLGSHQCMVYQPMLDKTGIFSSMSTTIIECDNGKQRTRECANILEGLKQCGMDMEPVFCGGTDGWYQDREQWHSGANFFALGDGKVIGYERNVNTIDALSKAGFSVLEAEDVCSGKVNMNDYNSFVVTFKASELPRAGGGARCMTMPINRD